jgi:hypothetical protein
MGTKNFLITVVAVGSPVRPQRVISLAFIGPFWQRDPARNDRLSQRRHSTGDARLGHRDVSAGHRPGRFGDLHRQHLIEGIPS